MSPRSARRLAALVSAVALAFTGTAMVTVMDSTVTAGACCTGHK